MKMIQPFGDRVLVRPIEPQRQTASGIFLPDAPREEPGEGIIVAIGEGSELQTKLSVGEHLLYQKFAGTSFRLEEGTFVLLAETDILGHVVEIDQLAPLPELTSVSAS